MLYKVLSPKTAAAASVWHNATDAGVEQAAVKPDEKAGVEPAFLQPWSVESSDRYFFGYRPWS